MTGQKYEKKRYSMTGDLPARRVFQQTSAVYVVRESKKERWYNLLGECQLWIWNGRFEKNSLKKIWIIGKKGLIFAPLSR